MSGRYRELSLANSSTTQSVSTSAVLGSPGSSNHRMANIWQLWLLFLKNAILLKRNKLWTFFELVLPVLFTLPIIILVLQNNTTATTPEVSFESVPLTGTYEDVSRSVGFIDMIKRYWCSKDKVGIGYSADEEHTFADDIIARLRERFNNTDFEIVATRYETLEELQAALIDSLYVTDDNYQCVFRNLVAGIHFEELYEDGRKVKYKILVPSTIGAMQEDWKLDTNWIELYGQSSSFYRIPRDPPYWKSGFLSLQHALDSAFIELVSYEDYVNPDVLLQRLPEPSYQTSTLGAFVKFLPILWGLLSFLIVLHAAKDASTEKCYIKDFLAVMGLSTPMFYLSHVLFSFMKCCIIFLVCAIPLACALTDVSWHLFIFTVLLYGYGVVSFGIFMSSMFKTANSTIKVTIILWLISVGIAYKHPNAESFIDCIFFSLNINGAFSMSINLMSDFITRGEHLGWSNMFAGGNTRFSFGVGLIMMIVDIIWMNLLTLLFDKLLAGDEFNIQYMFSDHRDVDFVDGTREVNSDANEVDAGLLEHGIEKIAVENLVKIWNKTGETAVDHLSLKTYAGQVTVLLGHNGAGKSTTFSMICGLVQPTHGNVKICGQNSGFHSSRKSLGLCPQGNALFDKLTVMEHLWLIHGLKGARNDYKFESKELLTDLKLSDKKNELSMNLSGGMKRKLCLSMALIGESEVVLLDEPTAGMDPGARRDVEKLLQKIKKDRSILLTTHYMDEAEVLGDRVIIMSKGRVVCSGSPEFLTKRYGVGYVMTVVVEEGSMVNMCRDKILETASQSNIQNAHAEQTHGSQLEFTLPLESQKNFPSFFDVLERNKKMFGISSFGVSLTTLEQVFLRVGEESEKSAADEQSMELYSRLIESQRDPRKTGFGLLTSQMRAVITKRVLYSFRHWVQFFVQFVLPVFILIGTRLLTTNSFKQGFGERSVSYNHFGPTRVVLQAHESNKVAETYGFLVEDIIGSSLLSASVQQNITSFLIQSPKEIPPIGFGASLLDETLPTLFFSAKAPHSVAAAVNLFNNALLQSANNGYGYIDAWVATYGKPIADLGLGQGVDALLAPVLVLALSLVTSTVVMFLVEERVSKFAHQQSLTGVSPAVFWGFSFLYDLVLYTLTCTFFTILFVCYGWMKNYLIHVVMMWVLYFWACVPFVYSVSFIMSSPSKANILLIVWQILATLASMLLLFLIRVIPGAHISDELFNILKSLLLFLLPSFAMGEGFMTLGTLSAQGVDPSTVWEWNNLGKNYIFMSFFGLFSSSLFLSFQFKAVRQYFSRIWEFRSSFSRVNQSKEEEDEDVLKERNRLATLSGNDDLAMEVKDLTKYYGKFCALDHLTIGVSNGECFGLLGVNGAGKTTTFNILTGINFPSYGTAKIDHRDVSEQIAIGYCPQFDAVLMDLTGRETLEILARLYGFTNPSMKASVVLTAVGLEGHADKLARFYSGGQRRKLSIGLALMASTRMVILDEPTAGIDPKARRDIWDVLSVVRNLKESAMLLTSHSMDECEALCNRIAILRRGRMIAVGTNQTLKSRFGNNYTLTIVAPSSGTKHDILASVKEAFPDSHLKTHIDSASLTMKWQVARSPDDKWSTVFAKCQNLADSVNAKDFCLAQSTLEETFLRLTNYEADDFTESAN